MGRKPPYGEMKKRGRNLEKGAVMRKQTEDALRESEERYRNLVENVRDVIYTLSEEGTFTSLNSAFESVTGWSRTEWIGKPLQSIVHPDDWPAELEFLELMLRGETPPTHEARVRASSGEYLVVESKVTPRFQGGKFLGVLGVARDITERKRAEEALRESEASYRELADSIADVFFAMDKELRYTYWNQASENLTGISAKDAIGKSLLEIFPDTPQTRKAEKVYSDVLRTQRPQTFVIEYQLGGKDFFFEISAYPTRSGLSVFVKDVTGRKRAEEQLEIKTRHLEEANTALKALLKRRDEDKRELEEKVLFNMKELASPYVEKLKATGLDERQMAYLSILESNLNEIISPFVYSLSSRYLNLTPAEIQIADLIRQGKTSKEIAEFLNLSSRTIGFHRANIREKMGIKNKKANLSAHLLSLH